MMLNKYIAPIALVTLISLTACGTNSTRATNSTTTTNINSTTNSNGIKEMKQTLVEMKAQIKSRDSEKLKESANKLEESWEKFEDGVKQKSPKLYEKVETPLHIIEAGAKVTPVDQITITKSVEELERALTEVEKI